MAHDSNILSGQSVSKHRVKIRDSYVDDSGQVHCVVIASSASPIFLCTYQTGAKECCLYSHHHRVSIKFLRKSTCRYSSSLHEVTLPENSYKEGTLCKYNEC